MKQHKGAYVTRKSIENENAAARGLSPQSQAALTSQWNVDVEQTGHCYVDVSGMGECLAFVVFHILNSCVLDAVVAPANCINFKRQL